MSASKFFAYSSILLFFMACGGDPKPARLFGIQLEKKEFQVNDEITIRLENKKEKEIKSVAYFIDGKELPLNDDKLRLNVTKLGNKELIAKIGYEETSVEVTKNIRILSDKTPVLYTYEIVNEYPHDRDAYTQGLEFYRDTLFESTGQKGASSIRKTDFRTGEIIQKKDLENAYFGEGITLLDGKLFLLTWQSGIGFVYDPVNLERGESFKYGNSKEGWGLCNDGRILYKSDGTERIWMLDPATLEELDYIETVTNTSVFNKANELEYVDGKIYANVWLKESMMIIDAQSGAIEGVVNFGGLKEKVTQHDKLNVLNGVAYNPQRKTFFVTGKYWDKMFEIKIMPKE